MGLRKWIARRLKERQKRIEAERAEWWRNEHIKLKRRQAETHQKMINFARNISTNSDGSRKSHVVVPSDLCPLEHFHDRFAHDGLEKMMSYFPEYEIITVTEVRRHDYGTNCKVFLRLKETVDE